MDIQFDNGNIIQFSDIVLDEIFYSNDLGTRISRPRAESEMQLTKQYDLAA